MTESARRKPKDLPPDLAPEQTQREASDPKTSVWVGASAGSGKTTVLTNRVMRLLLDGVRPQAILCLTFTRAAAAEMAIRVTERLGLWATCSDDALREDLDRLQNAKPTPKQLTEARRLFARVLSCPGGMRIRTIHAFCQEILGRFPVEAELPPHFAIIEENDAQALEDEVLGDLLREVEQTPGSDLACALKTLVHDLGEHRFMPAMHDVMRERARIKTATGQAGSLDKLIAQVRSLLQLAPGDDESGIIRAAVGNDVVPHEELRQAAKWIAEGSKKFSGRGKDILDWLAQSPDGRIAAFSAYWRCFLTKDETPYADFANKDISQAHPEIDAIMRREAQRLQGVLERLESVRVAETTEAVLRFGIALNDRYMKRKAAQAALDYDDLIIRANELLHRPGIAPWVLYKLDGGLDHILVDEAQDTSRAQWSIVQALADEFFSGLTAKDNSKRTLFVVGDEKQSIFGFQNADPDAFAEMRDTFARRLDEAGKKLRLVPMHVSFRSAPAILKAVDHIFARPEAQAGVSPEPIEHFAARPRAGEAEKSGRMEVWPVLSVSEKNKDLSDVWDVPAGYEGEHDPQAKLAELIATKIDGMIKAKERPMAAGDIMILLRNRGRFADLMVRALKNLRVPVTGVDRMKLTQPLPVMDLLALMQFALLPEDDLNLASVLRGPLLNLGEDELMQLAAGREGSLWHSLTAKQKNPVFAKAASYLTGWLNEADFITPFALLARILNEPCPGSAISGRRALWSRLGPDALDPIEELLNAAQDFSNRHAPSLQSFLHWVTAADATIKREMDHGAGQVRIMTVHGSKGLEAPVVFLPDTVAVPRTQDVPKLLWNKDNMPLYLPRRPTAGAAAQLWGEARRKQMEEYRRLLYVALTRAANRLYVAGWELKKDKPAPECWYNLIKGGIEALHEPHLIGPERPQPDIVFADPVLQADKNAKMKPEAAAAKITLPVWALKSVPEEAEIFRSVSPAQNLPPATATPDGAFARGRIIHRLLQSLPDVDVKLRETTAARFLANPQNRLTPEQQTEIQAEVMKLLLNPAYAPIFGPGSRAEVPMTGQSGGQPVTGQVDRLCLHGDEVWIVDYKTNRPPPATVDEAPPAYCRQLAQYRAILREVYPGKIVRCFLLWTYKPLLMELPDRVLAPYSEN